MAEAILRLRAEQDMELLSYPELLKVIEVLNFLCDNPLGAQVAGYRKFPEMRRAVAGKYLIYYHYEMVENKVRVYSVRHGARRPPKLKDLLPE